MNKNPIIAILALAVALCAGGARAADEPYFSAGLIFDGIPGYPSHHGSTIEELSSGELMAAWYSGAAEKATDVAIFASIMPADRSAWSAPAIIHDSPDESDGNPVLFEAPDHRLWLYYVTIEGTSWNDCPIRAKYSTDHGRTWSQPRFVREKKQWMTRNKPIVLSDGRILLPLYDERVFQSHFYISDDNGETWSGWGMIKQFQTLQPTVIERSDGDLFCLMRTGASNSDTWEALSKSKGEKWTPARQSGIPNPGSAVDMVKLANGHLVIAFNNSYTQRNPLSVALSTDEGRTWTRVRNIEADDHGSYSYPAIIQDRNGIIHLTYTWNRESIKHAAFNEAWIMQGQEKFAEKQ
jgi:predicted neuraminidase